MSPQSFRASKGGFTITTDIAKLNLEVIFDFLANHSHWARNIPFSTMMKSIENSLCFGLFRDNEQIGFARVVSDYATFAWLADVFILEDHRGKGLAKWLMECIVNHPDLQGLRRWILATRSAHGLYTKYGFVPLKKVDAFLEIYQPDIYEGQNEKIT